MLDLEDNLKSEISHIFHIDYMLNSNIDIMSYITYTIKNNLTVLFNNVALRKSKVLDVAYIIILTMETWA